MKDLREDYEPDGEPARAPEWEKGRVYADRDVGTENANFWRFVGSEFECLVRYRWERKILMQAPHAYGPFTPMRLKTYTNPFKELEARVANVERILAQLKQGLEEL